MPYPFVLAADGEYVARANFNGSWSVRWDRVLDLVYQPTHPRRVAVIAYAKILLAAKDNFVTTPWEVSTQWKDNWKHFQCEVEYIDHDPKPGSIQSSIIYNGDTLARVNHDGSWSICWPDVAELARLPMDDYRGLALYALCRLFISAKDRFWTTPWPQNDPDC